MTIADERRQIAKQNYYQTANGEGPYQDPTLLQELLNTIESNCFCMYLQPKADISTLKITGAEALVRLHHPTFGIVYPDKFISALEKWGTIHHLDLYIFLQVCKTLRLWMDKGIPPLSFLLTFQDLH